MFLYFLHTVLFALPIVSFSQTVPNGFTAELLLVLAIPVLTITFAQTIIAHDYY
jgi:hypothetical protein